MFKKHRTTISTGMFFSLIFFLSPKTVFARTYDTTYGDYYLSTTDTEYQTYSEGDQIPRACTWQRSGGKNKSTRCTDYSYDKLKDECDTWWALSASEKAKTSKPKIKDACVFKANKWQLATYMCSDSTGNPVVSKGHDCNTLSVNVISNGELMMGPSALNSAEVSRYTKKGTGSVDTSGYPQYFYRSLFPGASTDRLDTLPTGCVVGDATCTTGGFKYINIAKAELTNCYLTIKEGKAASALSCNQSAPTNANFCEPHYFSKTTTKPNTYQGWWWIIYKKHNKRDRTVCKGGVSYLDLNSTAEGTSSQGTAVTTKRTSNIFNFDDSTGITHSPDINGVIRSATKEVVSGCFIATPEEPDGKRFECSPRVSATSDHANFCFNISAQTGPPGPTYGSYNANDYNSTTIVDGVSTTVVEAVCKPNGIDGVKPILDKSLIDFKELKHRGNVKKEECFREILQAEKNQFSDWRIKSGSVLSSANAKWMYRLEDGSFKPCNKGIEIYHKEGAGVGPTTTVAVTDAGTYQKVYIGVHPNDNLYIGSDIANAVATIAEKPSPTPHEITLKGKVIIENDLTFTKTGGTTITGAATFGSTINVAGAATFGSTMNVTGASTFTGAVQVNNTINATNTITSASDERFKRNPLIIENALEKISNLRGVTYDFKTEKFPEYNFSSNRQVGIIAQELEKVLPEAVSRDSNGFLAVQYDRIVALVIESIKELNKNFGNRQNVMEAELISLQKKVQEQAIKIEKIENQCK